MSNLPTLTHGSGCSADSFTRITSTTPHRPSVVQVSSGAPYLNDAYRTLRQPVARVEYLLQLEGLAARGPEEAAKQVPPALLEEVFALNEELDEIRSLRESGAPADEWKRSLERAARPIEAKRSEHEEQVAALSSRWDSLVDAVAPESERRAVLEALRERVLERNYINNLLAGIERELGS